MTAADVDVQETVMIGGQRTRWRFQQVRGGRYAGAIAVPSRHTHSPVEVLDLTDAEGTAAALSVALNTEFPEPSDIRR